MSRSKEFYSPSGDTYIEKHDNFWWVVVENKRRSTETTRAKARKAIKVFRGTPLSITTRYEILTHKTHPYRVTEGKAKLEIVVAINGSEAHRFIYMCDSEHVVDAFVHKGTLPDWYG